MPGSLPRLHRLAPALLLMACVEAGPAPAPMPPGPPACQAEALRYLIGQNKSVLAAMRLQGPVRVIGPDTAVTMDYRPDRLNITHDRSGTILDLGCY